MILRAVAEINLSALYHNLLCIKKRLPDNCSVIAMLKGDAYGHGLISIAAALASHVAAVGVATLDEALRIREAGIQCPVVVFQGFATLEELDYFFAYRLEPVVHTQQQIDLLSQKKNAPFPLAIYVKIDTGMHRLGFPPIAYPTVFSRLTEISCIQKPISVMTHFADTENKAGQDQQCALFLQLTARQSLLKRTAANSAGWLYNPASYFEIVRPGILLYGASPSLHKSAVEWGFKPVMHLKARIIEKKNIQEGESIGYNGAWKAKRDTLIAIVSFGYGDGYIAYPTQSTVLIRNIRCRVVGRSSMDMLAVEIPPETSIEIGDFVTLWGANGLFIEEVARDTGRLHYELLTQITPRVKKIYLSTGY